MLPEEVTIILDTGYNLNKINQDKYSSEYLKRDDLYELRMFVRNTNYVAKDRAGIVVDRHNVELVHTTFPDGTFATKRVMRMYFVLEVERRSSFLEPLDFSQGLLRAFLKQDEDISTNASIYADGSGMSRLINGES